MIRVLHIVGTMNRAGQETFIMNMYRHMDRRNVQFDFIVHTKTKCDYEDEILSLGGIVYRVPSKRESFIGNFIEIRKIVRDGKYKIVHRHTAHALVLVDLIAAKCGGADTLIAHSHGDIAEHPLMHIILRPLLNKVSTLKIACSKPAGKWLFGKTAAFRVINNAIDAKAYTFNEAVRERLRMELEIDNKLVIGHIGRFTPVKNHDFLFEIFLEVLKINKNAILILIGDGELRRQMEMKASDTGLKDKILFTGIVDNVYEYLQAVDIFVFPSISEGLGIAVIEAQASGVPCIASDTLPEETGITELVSYVSLKEPAEAWAQKVIEAFEGHTRRDTYIDIKNANFDIYDNAVQLEKIYMENYCNGNGKWKS